MISKAYIQQYDHINVEPEHLDIKNTLEKEGIECVFFTSKKLHRNQLVLDPNTLVVGDNPTIMLVLKRMGINWCNDSYPSCLKKYLKRDLWESTVKKIIVGYHNNGLNNVFVKPKSKPKLFTGFVINSHDGIYRLNGVSSSTDLYCSSVVEFLSEYRVFVNRSKIVGIRNYCGNPDLTLEIGVVEAAILDFENSDQRTDAYGIDFGILKNGETALVEWNDAFALGSYGLDKEIYTDLIVTRWNEIMKKNLIRIV